MNWKAKALSIAGAAVLGFGVSGGVLAQDDKVVTVVVTQSDDPGAAEFFYGFVDTTVAQPLSAVEITGLAGGPANGSVGLLVKDTRVAQNRAAFDLQIVSSDFTGVTTPSKVIESTAFDLTSVTTPTSPNGVSIVAASGGLDSEFSIIQGAVPHDAFSTITYTLDLSLEVPADIELQTYEATLTVTDAEAVP